MTRLAPPGSMLPGSPLSTCDVSWEPLAEIVVALAAITEGHDQLGPRYPKALRQEAARLVADVCAGDAAAELGTRVVVLGVNRVVAAAITRDLAAPDDPAAVLIEELAARTNVALVPPPEDGYADRLSAMHQDSGFERAPIIDDHQRIALRPVRLLPPAPAGKLFARNTAPTQPLRMAFGDIGHVNSSGELDWAQWYRLGVWHATMNKRWAGQIARASTPELDAAFHALPPSHRRKAGVHEATVHTFPRWSAYFLDALVAAGKVVLEKAVGGAESSDDQRRWLRALGRVHVDWFVERIERAGIGAVTIPELTAAWLADHRELAGIQTRFDGPLAACESPLWSQRVEVCYSPSIPRATRRSLGLWLRGQWPGEVVTGEDGEFATIGSGPRLVYAVARDEDWLRMLGGHLQPECLSRWRSWLRPTSGDDERALLYTYRAGTDPMNWVRVCVGTTADSLTRVQRSRRPFADWTALDAADEVRDGVIAYDDQGRVALCSF